MTETYRTGRWKGLPKRCECGGKMVYERAFGRVFSACDTCSPEVTVRVPRVTPETPRSTGDETP